MSKHQDLSWLDLSGDGKSDDDVEIVKLQTAFGDKSKSDGIECESSQATQQANANKNKRQESTSILGYLPNKSSGRIPCQTNEADNQQSNVDTTKATERDADSMHCPPVLLLTEQKPGPDDPKVMEKDGITYFWCELCNRDNGMWNTHTTEDHRANNFSSRKVSGRRTRSTCSADREADSNNTKNDDRHPSTLREDVHENGCIIITLSDSDDDDNYSPPDAASASASASDKNDNPSSVPQTSSATVKRRDSSDIPNQSSSSVTASSENASFACINLCESSDEHEHEHETSSQGQQMRKDAASSTSDPPGSRSISSSDTEKNESKEGDSRTNATAPEPEPEPAPRQMQEVHQNNARNGSNSTSSERRSVLSESTSISASSRHTLAGENISKSDTNTSTRTQGQKNLVIEIDDSESDDDDHHDANEENTSKSIQKKDTVGYFVLGERSTTNEDGSGSKNVSDGMVTRNEPSHGDDGNGDGDSDDMSISVESTDDISISVQSTSNGNAPQQKINDDCNDKKDRSHSKNDEDTGDDDASNSPLSVSTATAKSTFPDREESTNILCNYGREMVNIHSSEGNLKLSDQQLINLHDFVKHALRQFEFDRVLTGSRCLKCMHCNFLLYKKSKESFACSSEISGGFFEHILNCPMIDEDARKAMRCLADDWNQEEEDSKKILYEIWRQIFGSGNEISQEGSAALPDKNDHITQQQKPIDGNLSKSKDDDADDSDLFLVSPEDKAICTAHVYFSLRQFRFSTISCKEAKNDPIVPEGGRCLRCTYCNKAFYQRSEELFRYSFTSIYNHGLSCKSIPSSKKEALKKYLSAENDVRQHRNANTDQKELSHRMWLRMHADSDRIDGASKKVCTIQNGNDKDDVESQNPRCASPYNEIEAIRHLSQEEKSLHSSYQFPILEYEKHTCTSFMFYLLRHYQLDTVTEELKGRHTRPIGAGCLRCRYCSWTIYRTKYDPRLTFNMSSHTTTECASIPNFSRKAIKTLKNTHKDQRIKIGFNESQFTKHIIRRMTEFGAGQGIKNDLKTPTSVPCESHEEPQSEKASDNALLQLPVMNKIGEKKQFSVDGLPSLTFTVKNEVNGHLYDFRVTVGDSLIPNSGYGAFLRLCRVRKVSKKKSRTLTRLPLLMTDEHGNDVRVFLTPNRIHDDIGCDDYVEDESIQFSCHDEGCGQIHLGEYGPFSDRDYKWEKVFDIKNFLFKNEPSRWNFGFDCKMADGRDMMLDITDDATGETHAQAMKHIPMYVNEVGHNPTLKSSVISSEDEDNASIRYHLCLEKSISVGETIELLVNYGEHYEETRRRHGYGKTSSSGSYQLAVENARMYHSDRVHMESLIFDFSLLELHDAVVSLKRIIDPVLRETTKTSEEVRFVSDVMARQWTARFRIHWLGSLMRNRYQMFTRTVETSNMCDKIEKILVKMGRRISLELNEVIQENDVVRHIYEKELLEESIFLCSKGGAVIHPLDPSMWCMIGRNLTYAIAKDLNFDFKVGKISLDDVVNKVYNLAKDAGEMVRKLCNDKSLRHPEALVLCYTSNETISRHVSGRLFCMNPNEEPYLDQIDNNLIRKMRISPDLTASDKTQKRKITKIDVNWYLFWNVVRVAHFMAKKTFNLEEGKNYSFKKLCDSVAVDIADGEKILNAKIDEPYGEMYTSEYGDHTIKSNVDHMKNSTGGAKKKSSKKRNKGLVAAKKAGKIRRVYPLYEDADGTLPEGWTIEYVKRKTGNTAGHVDRYWYAPDGTRIRSRSEIKRYLDILAVQGKVINFKSK